MKRILALSVLVLVGLALASGPAFARTPLTSPAAGPISGASAPTNTLQAFLASLTQGKVSAKTLAPDGAPYGSHYVDVDWDCVNWCQQDYTMCAQGCSACDQCSCQLAYCVSNCGIPFQGC